MSKRTPTRSTRSSATMDPDRKVGRKPSPDPPLSGIHSLLPMTSTSKTILTACFSRMTEHKWFSVLIENEQYTTTVAVGMNQTYEHVTALFLHLGYITTDRNKYTLVAKKGIILTMIFLELGSYMFHLSGEKKVAECFIFAEIHLHTRDQHSNRTVQFREILHTKNE